MMISADMYNWQGKRPFVLICKDIGDRYVTITLNEYDLEL